MRCAQRSASASLRGNPASKGASSEAASKGKAPAYKPSEAPITPADGPTEVDFTLIPLESGESPAPLPVDAACLESVSLGHLMDPKVKSKIWAQKYVSFSSLLTDPGQMATLALDPLSSTPTFTVSDKLSTKFFLWNVGPMHSSCTWPCTSYSNL